MEITDYGWRPSKGNVKETMSDAEAYEIEHPEDVKKTEWFGGKPKNGQEVWVIHKDDPVQAIFWDVGTLGAYVFIDPRVSKPWACSAYKCGLWTPYTPEKPEWDKKEDPDLPF